MGQPLIWFLPVGMSKANNAGALSRRCVAVKRPRIKEKGVDSGWMPSNKIGGASLRRVGS